MGQKKRDRSAKYFAKQATDRQMELSRNRLEQINFDKLLRAGAIIPDENEHRKIATSD
jgi:hypothetical protein